MSWWFWSSDRAVGWRSRPQSSCLTLLLDFLRWVPRFAAYRWLVRSWLALEAVIGWHIAPRRPDRYCFEWGTDSGWIPGLQYQLTLWSLPLLHSSSWRKSSSFWACFLRCCPGSCSDCYHSMSLHFNGWNARTWLAKGQLDAPHGQTISVKLCQRYAENSFCLG